MFSYTDYHITRLREFQERYGSVSSGKKSNNEETYKGLKVECGACVIAVELTRDFIDGSNATKKDILPIIDFFCVALKIEDPHVCSEIVVEFQSLFLYLFYLLLESTHIFL